MDTARSEPLRSELRWLAGELGRKRDAAVMAASLQEQIDSEPTDLVLGPVARTLAERFSTEARRGHAESGAALDSPRYAVMLELLNEVVDSAPAVDVTTKDIHNMARKAVNRVDQRLANAQELPRALPGVRALRPPSPGAPGDGATPLHYARKATKRARYAAEALEQSGGKGARRLAKSLKRLQDV